MRISLLGIMMLTFIALTGGIATLGAWFDNSDVILCAVLMMLQFLAVMVNEGIRVLREIRDRTNGER